ncbi:MAG: hypothetical protein EU531_08945 [Promethearchaeota archaeon]|nr:MAG: hypothetical protein EU531_08945 [Candidatus Lokiarchaeota archaeon]
MKNQDIQEIISLLKLVKIGDSGKDKQKEDQFTQLQPIDISYPVHLQETLPLVSVDGSYCFLFSFLGAETWIVLFRISVTEYCIENKEGKIYYCIKEPPKVYDHLNLLSFNELVYSLQPEVFSIAANIASGFQERKAQLFASNVMLYLEDKTLEHLAETKNNCILVKDGALLSYKALKREEIYKDILLHCKKNNIAFAGISKSTSTHFLEHTYTDDYFLKKFYTQKIPDMAYVYVPEVLFDDQTKFDVWGEVHFAKLHRDAIKWFRVDISSSVKDKSNFFSTIAAYSKVHVVPGYPIGLIEAHKLAKSVRDLKETYELELLQTLKDSGLSSEDILDGAVDMNGREYKSFHEILDQISK